MAPGTVGDNAATSRAFQASHAFQPPCCRTLLSSRPWLSVALHHYQELLNFLRRAVPDRDTAADLVQESYARVLAAQKSGLAVHDPRAMLYRTARNLVIDLHRRVGARSRAAMEAEVSSPDPEAVAGPSALEPETIVASREGLSAVLATIDRLPPRCREAFILCKFDGLRHAEIAERMGISVRTVEMQLGIAMAACWRGLEEGTGAERPARRQTPP